MNCHYFLDVVNAMLHSSSRVCVILVDKEVIALGQACAVWATSIIVPRIAEN